MATLKELNETLRDADALAEFANLEPGEVDFFHRKHARTGDRPSFLHDEFWSYQKREQWRMTQRLVRLAWQDNFKDDFVLKVQLFFSIYDPDELVGDELRGFIFPLDDWGERELSIGGKRIEPMRRSVGSSPFQKAVLFLFAQPWRARFCAVCNKRFVAAEPKSKFCSQKCSHEASCRRKSKWARKNRPEHTAYMKVW